MSEPDHQFVPRVEFEERLEKLDAKVERGFSGVGKRFDNLLEKLDEQEQKKRPGTWMVLGTVIAAIGAIGLPSMLGAFAIVVNMNQTRSLQLWAESHERFSNEKASELDAAINDLRVRVREHDKAIEEQEMQHRWMADVENLQVQRLEQMLRMKFPDLPASDYWPLIQIGKALPQGQ